MRMPTVIIVAGLITACSTVETNPQVTQGQSEQNFTEPCCSQFSQLQYSQLDDKNKMTLTLTPTSKVVQFTTGRSYVEGIQIPLSSTPITVTVQSSVQRQSVLVPSVVILNEHFETIDALDSTAMNYSPQQLLGSASYTGEIVLPVRYLDGSKPAYLVVFTTSSDRNGSTKIENPNDMAIQAGNIEANIAQNSDYRIAHSSVGSVVVKMDLTRVEQVKEHLDRQTQATHYVDTLATSSDQAEQNAYQNSIKNAVKQGDFSKALAYVEEAEKSGIIGMRSVFITEMKRYSEAK